MHCTRCGQVVVPGSAFCRGCGNPVATPSPAAALRRPGVVSVLAVLQYVGGGIALIAALALFAVTAGKGENRMFGLVVGVLFAIAGALQISCGFGLWNLRSWGRILQMVFAGIGLLGIPLGTVISILILVYLSKPGVKVLFSGKHPNRLTPGEIAAAWEVNQGGAGVVVAVVVGAFAGVALLGIIAAIAIPNFLNAVQRAKQKRTMSEMTEIATILEDRYREKKELPEIRSMEEFVGVFGAPGERLRRDGWSHEFRIRVSDDGYTIASAGKDGVFSESLLEAYTPARTIEFDADLVMRDGEWLVAPQGSRR